VQRSMSKWERLHERRKKHIEMNETNQCEKEHIKLKRIERKKRMWIKLSQGKRSQAQWKEVHHNKSKWCKASQRVSVWFPFNWYLYASC